VARGLCESRERAQRAIMAGLVMVDGQPAGKAGVMVADDAEIAVRGGEKFVGRGGLKLERALDEFGIAVAGRVCCDIGSSTGGFTDCLLQRGARRVFAIDVGRNQLAWRLRTDPRVVVMEGVNARTMPVGDLAGACSLAVADVSFISLTLIFPTLFALLADDGDVVVLIKPQFELTPAHVGKGGVVRNPGYHDMAVAKIRSFVESSGHVWRGVVTSPITGREGNVEFLAHCVRS
jgi:23S rRNA (cytidine1920-2'-O)/16S rRNA (cytidine1409-2'-O)-methyltransferase